MGNDSVQELIRRGRAYPDHCAFCGEPAEINIDLTTTNESMTKVEADAVDLPVCLDCLNSFANFAGDKAVVCPAGPKGQA